VAVRF